ncbi:substrate-binding domain-containing protein [Frankia sp. CNm7]|uniref:substrate-binding domain-containing protein n=1 Tax=Frankia nepalensis TaxID=1836974 RepID=UPI001931A936|nr:substrate-binding domain-containing protein [Frankia nepalensis]MBL7518794.1 substrate-binding domain-containing protein [Frankia nepalensis]
MNRPGITRMLLGIGAASVLALTACSQGSSSDSPAASAAPSAAGSASTTGPPACAGGEVRIALVRQLSQGDYFQQWLAGAQRQADALGVTLDVSSADGNNAQQPINLQQAINNDVDAIIVDHGFEDTVAPAIGEAVAADIPVVAFDVDAGSSVSEIVSLGQSDKEIASQALGVLETDTGGTAKVVYVYVAGYAPLDKRNAVWEQFKKDNPGIEQVAQIGVVNTSTAAATAEQAKAALQANPDATAIFAPYDEFAKGAVQAINELGLQDKVKVYGADISTADIGVITAPNSPWVATSATDPANVGAIAVRAAALKVAGLPVDASIEVSPALITQKDLRDRKITNIAGLASAFPSLTTPDIARIPWLS